MEDFKLSALFSPASLPLNAAPFVTKTRQEKKLHFLMSFLKVFHINSSSDWSGVFILVSLIKSVHAKDINPDNAPLIFL